MLWYFLIAVLAWPIIGGMLFHDMQSSYCRQESRVEYYRSDIGLSIVVGFLFASIWPLGLSATYCLTGFAQHGVFKYKE